jgi:hypothetical protein
VTENSKYQASVSYIGELAHTPPDEVLLVENDSDYVQACLKLSHFWELHGSQKVWVRSKNHFAWLRDFTEQIGCPSQFEEKTARLVLGEQWNVILPDWLTDADVLEQNLLEIDVDTRQRAHFESRFLARFLGSTFQTDIFSASDIIPTIKALVSSDAKEAFEKYPLLHRCLENRCNQWAERSSEPWLKDVCKRLPKNSGEIWQWLSLWAGLHGYPEKLLEYVLAPEQILFVREIPPGEIRDLPLEPSAREQMLTQIEFLFEEIREQVTSSDEFQKVVGWTTGKLSQEYQKISKILKNKQFEPTEADIEVVKEKFKSCPGVIESQLNSLIFSVKPSRPTLIGPEEIWSSTEWIRWTVEEYMPYRIWQVHNGQYDEDLEQTVGRFSDWYISEYASIHKDPDFSLTHCLNDITSSDSSSEFTIILLVDCLPIAFMELLDQTLRNAGLSRHDLHYRFAGAPTITEYNKTALLSGTWQKKTGNYEAVLKNRSASDWSGKNVVYLSNLKSLSEMEAPQGTTIAVLNFLDGDEILHSDVEAKNTTHEDELHRIFSRMAESVNRLSQEWAGSKEHFSVYVVTDHGACRILDEEKSSFDSAVVNKLFANEKHRFSAVTEDQVTDIPDNLWALGHRFERPFYDENVIYFLPRGHNTVRQTGTLKGYMHGGVTPEEVIVPTASYKMVKAVWKTPSVRFLNLDLVKETGAAKFYIQRVVTLEIEIQNLNSTEIRIHRASVILPETDLKSCETVTIPAGSVNTLRMNCYFKKAALDKKSLEIEIAYEIAGEQRTFAHTLDSEFKSAMSVGLNLRDL